VSAAEKCAADEHISVSHAGRICRPLVLRGDVLRLLHAAVLSSMHTDAGVWYYVLSSRLVYDELIDHDAVLYWQKMIQRLTRPVHRRM